MPVETATTLATLDPTNPPAADPMAQGADHLRLVKTVLKTTFPNFTGATTASHTDLTAIAATVARVTALEGNRVRTDIDSASTGSLVITGTGKVLDAPQIRQAGHALLPAGCVIMWGGTLATIPAGWALCDGTNGTPDLRSRFIVGAGPSLSAGSLGGSTNSTGVTDSQGTHSHGGATAGAGGHAHGGNTDAQGNHSHGGATAGFALTVNEMPSHTHTYGVIADGGSGSAAGGRAGPVVTSETTDATGGGLAHDHGISVDGGHTHVLTTTAVGDHQHGISADGVHAHNVVVSGLPPYFALCLIMKL